MSQMLYSFDIYGHGNEFEICEYNNGKSESEIYYYYNGKLNKDPQTEERKVEVRETQISDTLKQYEVLDEVAIVYLTLLNQIESIILRYSHIKTAKLYFV